MTSETLFEAIGTIDENYIKEAEGYIERTERCTKKTERYTKKTERYAKKTERYTKEAKSASNPHASWKNSMSWFGLAACAAIALVAAVLLPANLRREPNEPPAHDGTLPKLTVADFSSAFGFEGYLAYSPDELVDKSPWSEELHLETLPVFQNVNPADPAGYADTDPEALRAKVQELAERFGLGELVFSEEPSYFEGASGVYAVTGKADGVAITAYAHQQLRVEFTPALELPAYLNFTYYDSSYADMETVGEYLKSAYAEILAMESPTVNVSAGDYTYDGRQQYLLYLYDGAGSVADQMLSHDLANARFCCNEEGQLWIIWLNAFQLSDKMGDYPIVTPQEAKELLCAGNYITTVPAAMPDADAIVKTELIYRADITAEYFMPYYRFLVELSDEELNVAPESHADGLNTYGAYYVPAIRGEYLTAMPVWDGSFN